MPIMSGRELTQGTLSDGQVVQGLLNTLWEAVERVRRVRRWFLVDELTRGFIKALKALNPASIRSITLVKAVVKTVKMLKELASETLRLIKLGVEEAWRLSETAEKWGNRNAREWRNDKNFIILQALTIKWLSRLFWGYYRGLKT